MTNTQNNADVPELLPCPFCGEKAILRDCTAAHGGDNGYKAVVCDVCDASGCWTKYEQTAIDFWQARANLVPSLSPVAEGDERQEMLERIRAIRTRNGPSVTSLLGDLEKLERVLSAPLPGDDLAIKAIEFSITLDDHYDRLNFLTGWLEGDTSEYPDFAPVKTLRED